MYHGSGMRFNEEGREWKLPGFLYTNYLVLYGESEEDLKQSCFVLLRCVEEEVMVLGEEEGLGCEVCVRRDTNRVCLGI